MTEAFRQQVREGRVAAVEVTAPEGRRGFVIIRPLGGARTLEESLRLASAEGRIPVATTFVVTHDEYDATMLDGNDYDVGWTRCGEERVSTVDEAEAVIAAWGHDPSKMRPYAETDAP